MKKFIVAMAAILSMMIVIASPLFVRPVSAHAESDRYQNISELHSANSSILDENYIFFNITVEHDNNLTDTLSHGINLDPDLSKYNISFENNILDIAYINTRIQWYFKNYNGSNYSVPISSQYTIDHIYFDFENNKVKAVSTNNYWMYLSAWSPSYQNGEEISTGWYEFTDFDTDLDLGIDLGMDIEVNFYPSLSGDVDRKINGILSEDFTLEIINHSNFDVQCLMCILPVGEVPNFYDNTDETQDFYVGSVLVGNARVDDSFVWWSDEYNYMYTSTIQTYQSNGHAHQPNYAELFDVSKQYGPCPWHIVQSGRTVTHEFAWSQINLASNTNYNVYVYALRNDYGLISRQAAFPTGDFYVDYSQVELVYSSTFNITTPYTYDSSNTSHGNYKSNVLGNQLELGYSSKATFDSNNQATIQQRTMDDYMNEHKAKMKDYTESYVRPVTISNYGNSSQLSSLNGQFSSFFSFLNSALGALPAVFLTLITAGFSGLIIIGIIKVAIK